MVRRESTGEGDHACLGTDPLDQFTCYPARQSVALDTRTADRGEIWLGASFVGTVVKRFFLGRLLGLPR
jgi:hypothetical protein